MTYSNSIPISHSVWPPVG